MFCYKGGVYLPFYSTLVSSGYIGIFLGGIFYAYGFTAAPATAALLVLAKGQNILSAGIIGGLGALLSDMIIFLFVRYSFIDEIEMLKKEKAMRIVEKEIKNICGSFVNYFIPFVAAFFIASPLPTEVGVVLMATLKSISTKKFIVLAYFLHTIGIFIILLIGRTV
ncbi:MAG: hypothetical protein AAB929_00295 [Patescibacteria group bacterium]